MTKEYRLSRKRVPPPEEDARQMPADRLAKLVTNETYLLAAESGAVPEKATRNWVLFGNAALPKEEREAALRKEEEEPQ